LFLFLNHSTGVTTKSSSDPLSVQPKGLVHPIAPQLALLTTKSSFSPLSALVGPSDSAY